MATCEQIVNRAFAELGVLTDGYSLSPGDRQRGLEAINDTFRSWALYARNYDHTELELSDAVPGNGVIDRFLPYVVAQDLSACYGIFRVPPLWEMRSYDAKRIFYHLFSKPDTGVNLPQSAQGFSGNRREYTGGYPLFSTPAASSDEEEEETSGS